MKRRMKLLHDEITIIKKQRDRLKDRLKAKLETDAISWPFVWSIPFAEKQ